MKILNHRQIQQKIKRLAIQILENNYDVDEIIFAGINNNGIGFAQLILNELLPKTDITLTLTNLTLNPAEPLSESIDLGIAPEQIENKVVIIVDDVANTGRTVFYALQPLLLSLPEKVEVAVLVDRKHKSFPIVPDYFGLTLATTLQENIDVQINDKTDMAVYLN